MAKATNFADLMKQSAQQLLDQSAQTGPSITGASGQFSTPTTDQWQTYLDQNPDVAQFWANNTNNVQQQYQSPTDWAQAHYYQHGQDEGRTLGATTAAGGAGALPPPTGAAAWTPPPAPEAPAYAAGVTDNMVSQSQAAAGQNAARDNSLYDLLSQRATQSLNLTPDDPLIKQQTDAYRAEQTRGQRNFLADTAESSGPYANLRSEQRLAAERVGQNTAGFQADLMSRELASRREEIAQALSTMGSYLSADQQRELQREMALIDQATSQQQLGLQQNAQLQQWQTALMANDSFRQQLGLQADDRAAYYDAVRRGLFRPA